MELKFCPECGRPVQAGTTRCINCNTQFPTDPGTGTSQIAVQKKPRTSAWKKILTGSGALILVLLLGILVYGTLDYDGLRDNVVAIKKRLNWGEVVYNNWRDNSVYQVKDYLQRNLNDPSSLEFVHWSPVIKGSSQFRDKFLVLCEYRAKNRFGALIKASEVFILERTGEVHRHVSEAELFLEYPSFAMDIMMLEKKKKQ